MSTLSLQTRAATLAAWMVFLPGCVLDGGSAGSASIERQGTLPVTTVCEPGDRDYCHWVGACADDGLGCDCDDPEHYSPDDQCGSWHQAVVPPNLTCLPGDESYCNWAGECDPTGSECICDDPEHYDAAEQCGTWHQAVVPTTLTCLPGDRAFCNWQGACDAAGDACECDDPVHYDPADNCLTRHDAIPPAGMLCVPGDRATCSHMGTCATDGMSCDCDGDWWHGAMCEVSADQCPGHGTQPAPVYWSNDVCSGNGECVAPDTCDCDPGFGGEDCSEDTCLDAPTDPVGWWRGEDDATDQTGAHDGTAVGVGFVAGQVDQALSFDGTNSYINVTNDADLNFGVGEDFTIAAWVRHTGSSTFKPIVDKRSLGATPYGYELILVGGDIVVQLADGSGYSNYVSAAVSVASWHHVAVTVDRDASDGLVIYLDGAEASVHDPTGRSGDLTHVNSLLIGAGRDTTTRFFPGALDEVALFRRALDATEIAQLVSPGLDPTCVP